MVWLINPRDWAPRFMAKIVSRTAPPEILQVSVARHPVDSRSFAMIEAPYTMPAAITSVLVAPSIPFASPLRTLALIPATSAGSSSLSKRAASRSSPPKEATVRIAPSTSAAAAPAMAKAAWVRLAVRALTRLSVEAAAIASGDRASRTSATFHWNESATATPAIPVPRKRSPSASLTPSPSSTSCVDSANMAARPAVALASCHATSCRRMAFRKCCRYCAACRSPVSFQQ
mmetsp:Transcript_19219/g.48931  ORF Transcript_19219/g.48931 Transcript_19219/m.48931 type:complete len:231 (-) Transcript_19219:273-965(-)